MSGSQIRTLYLNSQLFSKRTYMAERQKVKPKVYGFLVEASQVLSSSLSLEDREEERTVVGLGSFHVYIHTSSMFTWGYVGPFSGVPRSALLP